MDHRSHHLHARLERRGRGPSTLELAGDWTHFAIIFIGPLRPVGPQTLQ